MSARRATMKIVQILLTYMLAAKVSTKDNTLLSDLPPGVAEQLLSLLTNVTIALTGDCGELKVDDVVLRLYNQDNPVTPIVLDPKNANQVAGGKETVLLIHGWISSQNTFVPEMSDAYLSRGDYNVITVDWSKISFKFYTTSVCYLPKVARRVAEFLCDLDSQQGVPVESIHLVGHSLGGQMSGLIGQETKSICSKTVGRITGLDPAGPLFFKLPAQRRLDRSDANFVDVIHTNGGILGYLTSIGDVDFYVNCGTFQLECPELTPTLAGIMDRLLYVVTCHHFRSIDYMTESISKPGSFQANRCKVCPLPCIPDVLRSATIAMGEDVPKESRGNFVLATNIVPPYGARLTVTNVLKGLRASFIKSLPL